ncbi:tetratricopeptide repeat protein, partial [Zymomonas mobilis]
ATAATWYQKAADQKFPAAEYNIAYLYEKGQGVVQDQKVALAWYQKAADQGFVKAQLNLASLLYHQAKGKSQNYKEAALWYQKAAAQGDVVALFMLGKMAHLGEGAARNDVDAYMWFSLAAGLGLKNAENNCQVLSKMMTPAQIAEAKKEAQSWLDKHPSFPVKKLNSAG